MIKWSTLIIFISIIFEICPILCDDSLFDDNFDSTSLPLTSFDLGNNDRARNGVLPFGIEDLSRNSTKIPQSQIDDGCVCGTTANTKVVGGTDSTVKDHPWIAQIAAKRDRQFPLFCAGSVISTRHILTAAHCLEGERANNLLVRLGRTRSTFNQAGYDVEEIRIHHRYSTIERYDIGIIVLKDEIEFSDKIQPVCLPGPRQTFGGQKGLVAGWGATSEGGSGSEILQELDVVVLEFKRCREMSNYFNSELSKLVICGYADRKDTCNGDSGGPLVVKKKNNYILAGITSWGYGCARDNFPGIYTAVARYVQRWIAANTKSEGKFCSRN